MTHLACIAELGRAGGDGVKVLGQEGGRNFREVGNNVGPLRIARLEHAIGDSSTCCCEGVSLSDKLLVKVRNSFAVALEMLQRPTGLG